MKQLFFKDKRSAASFLSGCAMLLALLFFVIMWQTTKTESAEKPMLVILLSALSAAFAILASIKNILHIPSLAAFALSVAAFFALLTGRVSYLAFYFSGDAMATGLSTFLVLSAILMLTGIVAATIALFSEKA